VRSIGGAAMTVGHLLFALHVILMLLRRGREREGAALLRRPSPTPRRGVAPVAGAAA
jgi:cytochrome c oxidase cbb3-type subunit 1